jgi:CRP-like cAMP-binding protein
LETVKVILHYSSIVYLKKSQTLYANGLNDNFIYVILYGRVRLYDPESQSRLGNTLNIGWTVGEEILFKSENKKQRNDICKAVSEACVLGIEKKNLTNI